MIALIVTIGLVYVISLIFYFSELNKMIKTIEENSKNIEIITSEIKDIKNDITSLKENPAEFTKRFSIVDLKINNLSKALETFNNGFNTRQSTMF